jgi:hypothetical protein
MLVVFVRGLCLRKDVVYVVVQAVGSNLDVSYRPL